MDAEGTAILNIVKTLTYLKQTFSYRKNGCDLSVLDCRSTVVKIDQNQGWQHL